MNNFSESRSRLEEIARKNLQEMNSLVTTPRVNNKDLRDSQGNLNFIK
jgi:hypothetical protein